MSQFATDGAQKNRKNNKSKKTLASQAVRATGVALPPTLEVEPGSLRAKGAFVNWRHVIKAHCSCEREPTADYRILPWSIHRSAIGETSREK
jgi:hypothetical protein